MSYMSAKHSHLTRLKILKLHFTGEDQTQYWNKALLYLVQRLSCSTNAQELKFEFPETLCIYSPVGKNLFTLCIRKTDAKKKKAA